MQAIVLGQNQRSYAASPAGSGPQYAPTMATTGNLAGAQAQPQLVSFTWSVMAAIAALAVLYFKVLGK